MALQNMAKIFAKQVKLGNKIFKTITPEDFRVQGYEIRENMIKTGELTEDELNDLLERE